MSKIKPQPLELETQTVTEEENNFILQVSAPQSLSLSPDSSGSQHQRHCSGSDISV